MNYDLPDNHIDLLHRLAAVPATEPLPEKLTKRYWALKTCLDRVGTAVSINDMARLCVECGFGVATEREASPDVAIMFRKQQVKTGAKVLVNWREEKLPGKIVGVNSRNEILVLLDNGNQETVKSDQVSLAAAA